MRFPDAVKTFDQDEPEVRDEDTDEVLQPARTVTKQAQYVLILELTRNQETYFIRTDNVEQYTQARQSATPDEDQGAVIGSWCIKYMDGRAKYGVLASEDKTGGGRFTPKLHQKQFDRIKALSSIILRDAATGAVLDANTVGAI